MEQGGGERAKKLTIMLGLVCSGSFIFLVFIKARSLRFAHSPLVIFSVTGGSTLSIPFLFPLPLPLYIALPLPLPL